MSEEEAHAYEVLAKRFGFSADYIKSVLEEHFFAPSDAGREQVNVTSSVRPSKEVMTRKWTLEEIQRVLANIDELRQKGLIKPLQRYIEMDIIKRDKHGKWYVASEEQLQQELALQHRTSIDPDGNLVQDGEIVKYGWLQSFNQPG
jgi:hypothetical protein